MSATDAKDGVSDSKSEELDDSSHPTSTDSKGVEMEDIRVTEETKEEKLSESDTKEESKEESKDSNKDAKKEETEDELDEEELEERKRLQEKLKIHMSRLIKAMVVFVSIDVILVAILAMPPDDWQTDASSPFWHVSKWRSHVSRLQNYQYDTLDISISVMLRLITLFYFAQLAIRWGDIKSYEGVDNKKKLDDISSLPWTEQIKVRIMVVMLNLWNRLIHSSGTEEAMRDNKTVYDRMKRVTPGAAKLTNTSELRMKTFCIDEVIQRYTKVEPQDLAEFWKSTLWLLCFTCVSLFQGYLGIKIVFFYGNYYASYMFFADIIISHIQLYLVKSYIDDATEPDNKFYDANIHPHPLFKRNVQGHWCDFCWNRIQVPVCYRCENCDFDICKKCWKKRRTGKSMAENKIRTDSQGVTDCTDRAVSTTQYMWRLVEFHRPHMSLLALGMICMAIASVIRIYMPSSRGKLFDKVVEKDVQAFYDEIKLYAILTFISGFVGSIQSMSLQRVNEQVFCDVQQRLYCSVMRQDMVFFDGSSIGMLSERLNWGLSDMLAPFQSILGCVVSDGFGLVGGLIMCWRLSWRLTLLSLSTLGPLAYLTIIFAKWHRSNLNMTWKLGHELWLISREGFENIRTVRSLGKEPSLVNHYHNVRQQVHNQKMKGALMQAVKSTIDSWFNLAASILIIWAGGIIVLTQLSNTDETSDTNTLLHDTMSVGALITYELYWNSLKGNIERIKAVIPQFQRSCFMARMILSTLDSKSSIETQLDTQKRLEDIDGDVCLNDVNFKYQMSSKPVLKNLNLTFEKGKVTALVGRSGGGKSTILKLIMRFYDPQEGSVTINGVNIKEYQSISLRQNICCVAQDTELFAQTLTHNIGYSQDEYTMDEILYASKLANAHEFIDKCDDKYYTRAGDKGTRISGGQKQRISIARMLMSKPKLMLLDEATSSLDAESESLVQAALEKAIEDQQCTVILVAHRLSTVVNADKICVIDDGQLMESGTHEELIEMNGVYARLVDRQMNLKKRMKDKIDKGIHNGKEGQKKEYDNIDALIDQIKAEKERERKNSKEGTPKEEKEMMEDIKESVVDG